MELQPFTQRFRFREGFVPDQPDFPGIEDSAIEGLNSWYYNGRWESDHGASNLGTSGGLSDLQVLGGQTAGCVGGGNLWRAFSTTFFTGNAFVNGAPIGNVGNVLSLLVGGVPTPAGLATPGTPTFAATGTTGRLNGAFSATVQAFRSTTGARSNRSAPSLTIAVQNKLGRLTFPAAPSGTTHWIVNGSIRGVPGGPWYRLTNNLVSGSSIVPVATASVDIDWVDGELGGLAAINFDPPPPCTHVAALGACVVALGTGTGGYGARPSLIANPEQCPPEYAFDLPIREAITGVQPGVDGVVLVSTLNGFMALLLSGATGRPILARVIFGNVGFAHSNAFCAVYDQIYGFSSKAGLVRTHGGGEPDSSFAAPVQKFFERNGFTGANTSVVFDQAHNAVLVCSGNKAVPFMRASGRWSAPIILPGTVSAGIALNGVAHLQIGSSVFSVDSAGAGTNWFLRSPYTGIASGYDLNVKVAREFYGAGNSTITHDLLVPDATWESGTSIGGYFPFAQTAPFGAAGARCKKPFRKFRAISYKASGTTGGQTPELALLKGSVYPIAA